MQTLKRIGALNNRYNSVNPLLTLIAFIALFATQVALGQIAKPELPEGKQTTLGLYVTAEEAYAKWMASPEKVIIIDVRTPEEYIFVGHAEMAWNIPVAYQTYQWDAEKKHFAMKPDPDFVSKVEAMFTQEDTLLLTCRSGGRSAIAVNQLAAAGFKYVYNITDGMEGDTVAEPGSVYQGKRMKNGWKNSAPWTYKLDPKLVILPETK